ncbi:MAG: Ig-like domain-containing protein [Bacteroidia bacterium]|nr:Ig-like domain-containing protein [Bacteroidia bacterium]
MQINRQLTCLLFVLPWFLLLYSCANIVPPSGGPVDKLPPSVQKESPPNGTVNFSQRHIEICFDEFISISETEKNISISPPLKTKPTITVSGKCVHFALDRDETLLANTTYTINFGSSIADLNESNKAFEYNYAFSTGSFIDTLYVGGLVTHSFTRQKISDFTVGLYSHICDSCVEKERPLFYTKSITGGVFKINRVKPGLYYIAGFKDENSNGMADKGELFAFTNSRIGVTDSNRIISLFAYTKPLYAAGSIIDTVYKAKGETGLVFYKNPSVPLIKTSYLYRWTNRSDFDTLFLYSNTTAFTQPVEIIYPEKTIKIPSFTNNEKAVPLQLIGVSQKEDTVTLSYSTPVASVKKDSVSLKRDSVQLSFKLIKKDSFSITIIPEKKLLPGTYILSAGTGFVTDIFQTVSAKNITYLVIKKPEDYGTIGLNLINPKKTPVILLLVDEKNEVHRELVTAGEGVLKLKDISPGTYRLKIVFDTNKNGIWDGGDLNTGQQPERVVFLSTSFQVRPDWDLDNNIVDIESFK